MLKVMPCCRDATAGRHLGSDGKDCGNARGAGADSLGRNRYGRRLTTRAVGPLRSSPRRHSCPKWTARTSNRCLRASRLDRQFSIAPIQGAGATAHRESHIKRTNLSASRAPQAAALDTVGSSLRGKQWRACSYATQRASSSGTDRADPASVHLRRSALLPRLPSSRACP
jgi:hypothetical protein